MRRRLLRFLLYALAILLVAVIGLVAYGYFDVYRRMDRTYAVSAPSLVIPHGDAAALERGRYLATTVASCVDCHAADFGGQVFIDAGPMATLSGTNLTKGRGGIGQRYADEDFVRALTHGVRKDGRSVVYMPSHIYKLSASDTAAIVAYLRSRPPVDRETPAPRFGPLGVVLTAFGQVELFPAEHIDHARFQFASADRPADPAKAGEQIVAQAGCRGCHGPALAGGLGPPPGGANLTPVGLGHWTEADFFRAMREHKRPNGTAIAESMPRSMGQMSDADLAAVFAYLRTVPSAGTRTASQTQTAPQTQTASE
jgi:cytochrome c553